MATIPASFNGATDLVDVAKEISSLQPENQQALILGLLPDHRSTFLKTLIASMTNMQRTHTLETVSTFYEYLTTNPQLNAELLFGFTDKIQIIFSQDTEIEITKIYSTLYGIDSNGNEVEVQQDSIDLGANLDTVQKITTNGITNYIVELSASNSITPVGNYKLKYYVEAINLYGEKITYQDEEKYPGCNMEFTFEISTPVDTDKLISVVKHINHTEMIYYFYNVDGTDSKDLYIIGEDANGDFQFEEFYPTTNGNLIAFNHPANLEDTLNYTLRTSNVPTDSSSILFELNEDYVYSVNNAYVFNPIIKGDYIENDVEDNYYQANILPLNDMDFVYDFGFTLNNPNFSLISSNLITIASTSLFAWDPNNLKLTIDKTNLISMNEGTYTFVLDLSMLEKESNEEFTLTRTIKVEIIDAIQAKSYISITAATFNEVDNTLDLSIYAAPSIQETLNIQIYTNKLEENANVITNNDVLPFNETIIGYFTSVADTNEYTAQIDLTTLEIVQNTGLNIYFKLENQDSFNYILSDTTPIIVGQDLEPLSNDLNLQIISKSQDPDDENSVRLEAKVQTTLHDLLLLYAYDENDNSISEGNILSGDLTGFVSILKTETHVKLKMLNVNGELVGETPLYQLINTLEEA